MASLSVILATRDYDFVSPLATGDVKPQRLDLILIRVFDSVERVASDPSIHGGEASFSRYVYRISRGDQSLVGLPLFLNRAFRHRSFYVRRGSPLTDVTHLVGKRVGTDVWAASTNIWSRAILRERGVSIHSIRWLVGPVDPGDPVSPRDSLPHGVEPSPPGRCLRELLLMDEIDAIMSIWPPKDFYANGSRLRRLYEDYRAVEHDYYHRTGIYPGHHILVLQRALIEQEPWVVRSIYIAFKEARERSDKNHWVCPESSPWLLVDLEEQAALMGEDFQPYGYRENKTMVAAFCGEQYAQGLIQEPLDPDSLFAEFERLIR